MARSPESAASPPTGPQGDAGRQGVVVDVAGLPVAILGCGAVGSLFAVDLAGVGAVPLLWSRTEGRAEDLASRIFGAKCFPRPEEAIATAAVTLLCVADQALERFSAELAVLAGEPGPEHACLHTNGARGLGVLAPLEARGFGVGKLHPLIAVPPTSAAGPSALSGRFRGAWFASLGRGSGEAWARRLVGVLGAHRLQLADDGDESSIRLHAAAALLSGGFVAVYDLALEAAEEVATLAGEDDRQGGAGAALTTLLASTVSNLARHGTRDALTGPVARGSLEVVRAHLETLSGDAREAYQVLGRRMLALSLARGGVDAVVAQKLATLLGTDDQEA